MNLRKWLIVVLSIVMAMSLATYAGSTMSLFTDDQQSIGNIAGIRWGLYSLSDGFEVFPWDNHWNDNGATDWFRDPAIYHTGLYSAGSDDENKGYLTSDDIDASSAENMTISFWVYGNYKLSAGECIVELYDGTSYNTWYDMTAFPGYSAGGWVLLSQVVSDPAYLFAGFRLRFNTTNNNDGLAQVNVDDVNIATDSVPPSAPTGLTATAGDTRVYLDWDDNSESDLWGYNVYRSTSNGTGYAKVNPSPIMDSNYTDTGRTNGTTYYYVVTAADAGNNESSYSNQAYATPQEMAPEVPTGLTATAGEFRVVLDWDDNDDYDFAGYKVYRSLTQGSGYSPVGGAGNLTSSNFTDTGLTPGVTYYYVVTAFDTKSNESNYSAEVYAVPTNNPPAAPTGLDATAGDKQVSLDWNDNTEVDLAGYNVYRSTTSGSGYVKINGSLAAASVYTDTTVNAGTTYYYVVRAVDGTSQESGNSNQDSATPYNAPPAAPSGLVGVGGNSIVTLSWTPNTEDDLAGYSVYRSTSLNGTYTKITPSLISTSNHTDTGLVNGTTYYYRVTATDDIAQESAFSNTVSATPGDPPPAAPTGLTATPGDKQISLDWNNNTEGDLAGYNVYRSLTSGTGYTKINSSVVTYSHYLDTGRTGNTVYYYVVTAVDLGSNESGYSNQASATPTDPTPAAPTGLVRSIASQTVYLGWNSNSEADMQGYNVYRSLTSGGPYTKINSGLVGTTNYTDTSVTNETAYFYVVTAVDLGSNESGYSNQVRAVPFARPVVLLNDGFEGTPWDANWDGNGTTSWYHDTTGNIGYISAHSGTYSARSDGDYFGYLTTDDIDASVYDDMTVSFWFYGGSKLADNECFIDYWNGEEYVTQYDIKSYSGYSSGAWFQVTQPIPNTSYLVDDFKVRFRTVDMASPQAFCNVDDVTIIGDELDDSTAPSAPTGLEATAGDTEVYLEWNYNTEVDLWGYNVYRSTSNGTGYAKINSELVSYEEYTDTGRSNGTTYYYVITAVDYAANESVYSAQAWATPTGLPPAAPTGLTATAGEFTVTLDWNDNTDYDLTGYNVYRGTASGNTSAKINGSLLTSSNYTDTGLAAGTTYYYVVKAYDGTYESGASNEASAKPYDNPPAAPTGLTATPGNAQISLDWNDNSEGDLAGYNVYRSTSNGTGYAIVNGSLLTSSNYTDTGWPAAPFTTISPGRWITEPISALLRTRPAPPRPTMLRQPRPARRHRATGLLSWTGTTIPSSTLPVTTSTALPATAPAMPS
jgi:fibronectin type 3 domain-containing protein